MRKRPLAYAACVFLTGLLYQRYQIRFLILVIAGVIGWEIYAGRKAKNVRKTAGRSIALLSAFLLGIFHMHSEASFRDAYMSKVIDGSQVTVWGELIKTETTDYGVRGILTDCYIYLDAKHMPCNDIMVYFSSEEYQLGQIHQITGELNLFSGARNQGNFDALMYYQSLKIDCSIKEASCEYYESGSYGLHQGLLEIRQSIAQVYQACMQEKAAGFYQAMVLGDKTNLDEVLQELFTLGGIAHILAISGLHVSIIGRGLYRFLRGRGIGFGLAGIIGSAILLLYGMMVGNSTSTVRAIGMLMLFFLSQGMGRSYDMLNALGAMVLFLLWENPFLIENTGFWFSVTALLGVGIVRKTLSEMFVTRTQSKKRKLRVFEVGGLWMSVGITLTTLPVTALSYYEIPLYAPIVNFVVLPLLTPVFVLAVVGGVLGTLIPSVEVFCFILKPCEWLLAFYEWTCNMVTKLPGARLLCGKPETWQVVVYYLVLFGGVYVMHAWLEQGARRIQKNIVLVIMCLICGLCIFFPKSHDFEITFLDVGQGDGIYISAGDGTNYFIDGGSSNVNGVGVNRILPFLKSRQVGSIDYWFVSHCDTDHMSGLLEILENGYKVEHIVLYEQSSDNENYTKIQKIAQKVETKIVYIKAGDKVCSRDMEITCLAPDASSDAKAGEDVNENSLVLQVDRMQNHKAEFTALFAGDISSEMENSLCESGLLEAVDLVKANHHGSNYSNGELWFETLCPEYIIVSCSATNLYGHPGTKAVERMEESGAQIFYTMENGQVTFPLIQ